MEDTATHCARFWGWVRMERQAHFNPFVTFTSALRMYDDTFPA